MRLAQGLALGLVHAYRAVLKPLLPAACRFDPSCSTFALEAIRVHGAWRGGRLALGRLLRCRPGGGGGPDPVPAPQTVVPPRS
jgi:putative membrane protein insertion efficiency factor